MNFLIIFVCFLHRKIQAGVYEKPPWLSQVWSFPFLRPAVVIANLFLFIYLYTWCAGLAGAVEPDAADGTQEEDQRAAAAPAPLAHGRLRQAGQVPVQVIAWPTCVDIYPLQNYVLKIPVPVLILIRRLINVLQPNVAVRVGYVLILFITDAV